MEKETVKRELLSEQVRQELESEPIPAYMHYQGQVNAQPAFIRIAPEDEFPITVSYNADPGNSSMSMMTWLGREIEIPIYAETAGASLLEFIEEHADDFWTIIDGYSTEWDGNNTRGKLSDVASDMLYSLERVAKDELVTVPVWSDINDLCLETYITANTDARQMAKDTLENIECEGQVATFDEDELTEYIEQYRLETYFEEVYIEEITMENLEQQIHTLANGILVTAQDLVDDEGENYYIVIWHEADGMPSDKSETYYWFDDLIDRMLELNELWYVRA